MRVLTVRQPWAWALIHGGKDVENRTRNIAGKYRGPVAIHVALKFADMPHGMPTEIARAVGEWRRSNPGAPSRDLPDDPRNSRPVWYGNFGHVIGVVDLTDVHPSRTASTRSHAGEPVCFKDGVPIGHLCSEWAMRDFWHLEVANPRPLAAPIPAKGRLGLWTPDDDLRARIEAVV